MQDEVCVEVCRVVCVVEEQWVGRKWEGSRDRYRQGQSCPCPHHTLRTKRGAAAVVCGAGGTGGMPAGVCAAAYRRQCARGKMQR